MGAAFCMCKEMGRGSFCLAAAFDFICIAVIVKYKFISLALSLSLWYDES